MLRRRTLIQGLLATVATPALAQNSFLTPGGSSVPGIVTMCLSSNVAVPCATSGGSFPPNISGTQATIAADFAGQQYWAVGASKASFAAWLTAIGGTYARASSATYLQGGVVQTATANTPRFPTDLGGTAQGIRLTGPATNLHLQSSISSSIASYNPTGGALTANAGTDPSGGSAAASFIPTAVANNHTFGLLAGVSLSASTTYTWSMFVKAIGANTYNVLLDPENGPNYSWFSLAGSGSVLGNAGTGVGSIQPLANGWFLLSVTFPRVSAGTVTAAFYMSDAAGGTVPAGDGTSGWLMWGMNFTATAFPCDYIPTTTATVTQAADLISSFTHAFGVNATITTGWQQSPDPTTSGSNRLWNCDSNAPGIAPQGYILPSAVGNITQRAGINNAAYSWDATTLSVVMNGATQQDNLAQAVGAKTLVQIGAFTTSPSTGQPNANVATFALWDIRATTAQLVVLAP